MIPRKLLPCLLLIFSILLVFDIYIRVNISNVPHILRSASKRRPPILDVIQCNDINLEKSVKLRGHYMVLNNFVKAEKTFKCYETITLTTPGDVTFLDNVVPLLKRWMGPISIALYTPGSDIEDALNSIAYLRSCTTWEVKAFVSFHLFFEDNHMYNQSVPLIYSYKDYYNCALGPPYKYINSSETYKARKKLLYPINVARNIARENAQTYFIFPSDIELYPTPNVIEKFLDFVIQNPSYFLESERNVFVLPVFEIRQNASVPDNKTALQKMLAKREAILFHEKVCSKCHKVIKGDDWIKANETSGLNVFSIGKRQGKQRVWEPFYICTQKEPYFDDRLTWEGHGNKMTQAYSLCLLDYNFNILDNAFLTHKPGVKEKKTQLVKYRPLVKMINRYIKGTIKNQLINMYGNNSQCVIKD